MKGQTNTVFTFIFVAIVIGLIVVFGGVGIQKIMKSSNDVATNNLLDKVSKDVKSLERLRGSSEVFSYKMPSNVDKVCFVVDKTALNSQFSSYLNEDLFLLDGNLIVEAKDVGNIYLEDSLAELCKNVIGPVEFRFTGQGDGVLVE